jgi:apolipoprotein N-acyltransferase
MEKTVNIRLAFDPERAAAVIGIVFGLATIVAGGTVLLGRDPGYLVYRPLLVFNTAMGIVYLYAAVAAWRRQPAGRATAGWITTVNAAVLLWIVYLHQTTRDVVANDSVRAMTLRTVVWAVLYAVLAWVWRRKRTAVAS